MRQLIALRKVTTAPKSTGSTFHCHDRCTTDVTYGCCLHWLCKLQATISMQANGLWSQLAALKKVVTEPKGTGEAFDTVMKDYYTAINRGQGGLFMAVCRGKVCTAAWDGLQRIRSCKPCRM